MEKVEKFAKWVLDIEEENGDVVSVDGDDDPSWVTIPSDFLIEAGDCGLKTIIDSIYPDLYNRLPDKDYLHKR